MAELSFFVLSICATVFVAFFFATVSRATGGRAKPTFFGVLFLCLAGLIVLLCWPDMFVHGLVRPESVSGTYKLKSAGAFDLLRDLGYLDRSAQIEIDKDGALIGKHIPYCCLTGDGIKQDIAQAAYYDIKGRWKLIETQKGVTALQLEDAEAKLSGGRSKGPWTMPKTLELRLLRGKPTGLSLQVFTGDFHYVCFSR